ncbi:MAG: pentapeptide repeat-containing protein [Chloroflexota bacterium]
MYLYGGVPEFRTITTDFYANASSELISISITVLILDTLNKRRANEDRKSELFRKAKSRSNILAIDAVDQILHEKLWKAFCENYKNMHNKTNLSNVQWEGANLNRINLENTTLMNANLKSANLNNAILTNVYLCNSNLEYTDLSFSNLKYANLSEVNAKHSNLHFAHLEHSDLLGAHFEHANLSETQLCFAKLFSAHLEHTDLTRANLDNVDFTFAHLEHADLRLARIENTNLSQTKFNNSNLFMASLRGSKNIETAEFNEKTVLPDANNVGNFLQPKFDKFWTQGTDMTRYTDPEHPDFWEPNWVNQQNEDVLTGRDDHER